jgi:hypothetical protein
MLATIQLIMFHLVVCYLKRSIKLRVYEALILPVVLCGRGTLPLTLREGNSVFENRMLRRAVGCKSIK